MDDRMPRMQKDTAKIKKGVLWRSSHSVYGILFFELKVYYYRSTVRYTQTEGVGRGQTMDL